MLRYLLSFNEGELKENYAMKIKGSISNIHIKELLYQHRDLLLQAYWLIYLPWFVYLEDHVTTHFHVIHMDLDDAIPFLSVFCTDLYSKLK